MKLERGALVNDPPVISMRLWSRESDEICLTFRSWFLRHIIGLKVPRGTEIVVKIHSDDHTVFFEMIKDYNGSIKRATHGKFRMGQYLNIIRIGSTKNLYSAMKSENTAWGAAFDNMLKRQSIFCTLRDVIFHNEEKTKFSITCDNLSHVDNMARLSKRGECPGTVAAFERDFTWSPIDIFNDNGHSHEVHKPEAERVPINQPTNPIEYQDQDTDDKDWMDVALAISCYTDAIRGKLPDSISEMHKMCISKMKDPKRIIEALEMFSVIKEQSTE